MVLLEQARQERLIGSSVEAAVELVLPQGSSSEMTDAIREQGEGDCFLFVRQVLMTVSSMAADILQDLFVVSSVELLEAQTSNEETRAWVKETTIECNQGEGNEVVVRISPSRKAKCPRCWLFTRVEEEQTCKRCGEVLRA